MPFMPCDRIIISAKVAHGVYCRCARVYALSALRQFLALILCRCKRVVAILFYFSSFLLLFTWHVFHKPNFTGFSFFFYFVFVSSSVECTWIDSIQMKCVTPSYRFASICMAYAPLDLCLSVYVCVWVFPLLQYDFSHAIAFTSLELCLRWRLLAAGCCCFSILILFTFTR